jgi:hypothetical protein
MKKEGGNQLTLAISFPSLHQETAEKKLCLFKEKLWIDNARF